MPIEQLKASPLLAMRCGSCGYGVSRSSAPERCPMCGGADWEYDRWRPFTELARDLDPAAGRGGSPTQAS